MSKFYFEKPDTIGGVVKIVKISDSDGKLAKEQGFKVFDTYEDAVAYRGEIANKKMNKEIKTEKFLQTPEIARTVGAFVLPATYESLRHGEEPGFKESSIDASLIGLNFIPGGRLARTTGAKVGLPLLTTIERKALQKGLPGLVGQAPAVIAGETALAGAAEGLTSIGQDREFDPMNVAFGAGLGTLGAGLLPGERSRAAAFKVDVNVPGYGNVKALVPGSEVDKRLLDFGSKGIKPGVKLSDIATDEIESVLTDIVNKENIDLAKPGVRDALIKRLDNLFTRNKEMFNPETLKVLKSKIESNVDNFLKQKTKYSPKQFARLPDLSSFEEQFASRIRRSAPAAVSDVLAPEQSQYLMELGRLRNFDVGVKEKPIINKIPVISNLLGIGGGAGGLAARGGRQYLPTLMGLDETKQDK